MKQRPARGTAIPWHSYDSPVVLVVRLHSTLCQQPLHLPPDEDSIMTQSHPQTGQSWNIQSNHRSEVKGEGATDKPEVEYSVVVTEREDE